MIDVKHSILLIIVIALVTMLTRFLPFLIFRSDKKTPKFVMYLSNVLPTAIIGMLVVYCLKDVSVLAWPYGLPELIAVVFVAVIYIVSKRNTLLSVGLGTVGYMLLVQFVFKS